MRALLVAATLLFLLLPGPSVGAEAPSWDQKQVSALAGRLLSAIDALLADPDLDARQGTAMQQREHEAAISTAKELRRLVAGYKSRIDMGYSQEDSRPFWDQVDAVRGDIQAYARHSWLPPKTDERADRVSELFDELALYYPNDL